MSPNQVVSLWVRIPSLYLIILYGNFKIKYQSNTYFSISCVCNYPLLYYKDYKKIIMIKFIPLFLINFLIENWKKNLLIILSISLISLSYHLFKTDRQTSYINIESIFNDNGKWDKAFLISGVPQRHREVYSSTSGSKKIDAGVSREYFSYNFSKCSCDFAERQIMEFDSSFHLPNVSGCSWAKSAIECVDWTTW